MASGSFSVSVAGDDPFPLNECFMIVPEQEYADLLEDYKRLEIRYQKICRSLTWLRLFSFLGILISLYTGLNMVPAWPGFTLAVAFAVSLAILVILHVSHTRKRDFYSRLRNLCEAEIRALRFEYLDFEDGAGFMDNMHAFSGDIDLFGPGSAFQYINRTVTFMGRMQMADWLTHPCLDPEEITLRQESCREMSGKTAWRLDFAASGIENPSGDKPDNLFKWLKENNLFKSHSLWNKLLLGWQALLLLLLFSVIAGWLEYGYLLLAGFGNLVLLGAHIRRINGIARMFGKTYTMLESSAALIGKLGKAGFKTPWISSRIELLLIREGSAIREMEQLRKLLQRFDSRNNLLVGFFRNALFVTDLQLVIRMEEWKIRNAAHIPHWLEVLGQLDALNSLATFAFNNPGYAYPVPVSGDFRLEANELGHPLISGKERICNDFRMNGWHAILVLTGANMAGKSTFLRTVGLNHILAHTGGPVCATGYRFLPSRLITSIRTNDSLIKHESYFYAELKKLKSIIDALEKGEEVFILLDEVLKGTNSNDKLNGSLILIRKLLQLSSSGIIATHDIALGELSREFPDQISTSCFEAEIKEDQLHFDYKLKPGTARNMTAIFLMKQMGIV